MKKSDLKTGMRVKFRNGDIYLVIKDIQHIDGHQELAFVNENGFMLGSSYNDELNDMSCDYSNDYDVMEVYQINDSPISLLQSNILNLDERHLIWKRPEYTEEQKETFKALKVLGYKFIARDKDGDLTAYNSKPTEGKIWWFAPNDATMECELEKETFDFIKWEDTEPFEIP